MTNDIIKIIAYQKENLDTHPSINHIKEIFPTLWWKIEEILKNKWITKNKSFSFSWINNIKNNFDIKFFEEERKVLINTLEYLSEILWWKKPIIFISDWCFTNDLFIRELKEILANDYDKFVKEVNISYENESKNNHIWNYLYENSILILWWSYTNLSDIPNELLKWELVKFIKEVHNNRINSKLIWICWWHQFISHIIWLDEMFSEKIITTYIWEAQFWVMPWKLTTNINNFPFTYRNALNSITNNWQNKIIPTVLTRTWHVDLDFLRSYRLLSQSLIPLVVDPITWSNRICWSKNSQYLWVQDHFEINPKKDIDILYSNISELISSLKNIYWENIKYILENIEMQKWFNSELAKPFYTSALSSFACSILAKHRYKKENNIWNFWINKSSKSSNITETKLKKIISKENFGDEYIDESEKFYEKLDKIWILKMVSYLDRSVSRWIEQSSDILWLDLIKLIQLHKIFIEKIRKNKGNYVFRDLWAWRWKLIDDIKDNFNLWNTKDNSKTNLEVISTWVSNFAYFNIYEWIIKINEFRDIPRNILKIFVEELLNNYNKLKEWNEKEKFIKALQKIKKLSKNSYKICTMFSESTTYRFNDKSENLSQQEIVFLNNNYNRIEELINYLENNFYSLIVGAYDKMIFADFNSLYIENKEIKWVDFQTAIRSTCHIDSNDLVWVLNNYIEYFAKPWSIFIDNWVVRSDSWVPRIKEFLDLEKNNKDIKVTFIYDKNTSYITWAIINKTPYIDINNIRENLKKWYLLLSTDEIENCSFFKIERFFRELIIFTFKDLKFSHDKNNQIIKILKKLSYSMYTKNPIEIKKLIIEEINILISEINQEYDKSYAYINEEIFELYLQNVDKNIIDFFKNWKIIVPHWFNQNFERNN